MASGGQFRQLESQAARPVVIKIGLKKIIEHEILVVVVVKGSDYIMIYTRSSCTDAGRIGKLDQQQRHGVGDTAVHEFLIIQESPDDGSFRIIGYGRGNTADDDVG